MPPTTIAITNRRKQTAKISLPRLSSWRNGTFRCHSAASAVSTLMMPSTPRSMPPEKSLALEARRHGAGDDHRRQRIGQRAFEAVADLDAHFVLGRRDEEQHAVVLLGFAELPEPEQLIGIGLDVAALQRFHRGDDQLDAGLVLQLLRLRLDGAAGRRRLSHWPDRRRGRSAAGKLKAARATVAKESKRQRRARTVVPGRGASASNGRRCACSRTGDLVPGFGRSAPE